MGNYLNPGNDMFYKMVHSEIYVDKTGLKDWKFQKRADLKSI